MATNAKATGSETKLDTAKLATAALLVVGGVFSFYYLSSEYSLLLRVVALLVLVGLAIGIGAATDKGRDTLAFVQDARTEVRKVVWPSRQETVRTTLVVLAMVIVVAILLWLLDMVLLWAVGLITRQEG